MPSSDACGFVEAVEVLLGQDGFADSPWPDHRCANAEANAAEPLRASAPAANAAEPLEERGRPDSSPVLEARCGFDSSLGMPDGGCSALHRRGRGPTGGFGLKVLGFPVGDGGAYGTLQEGTVLGPSPLLPSVASAPGAYLEVPRSSKLVSSSFSRTPAALIPRLASSSLIRLMLQDLMLEVAAASVSSRLSSDLFRRYDLTGSRTASTADESSPSSLASIAKALSDAVSSRILASVTRALNWAWYSSSARIARSCPRKAWMTSLTTAGTQTDFRDASFDQNSRSTEFISLAVSAFTARRQRDSSSSSFLSDDNAACSLSDTSG